MKLILEMVEEKIKKFKLTVKNNIVATSLYVSDMSEFAIINEAYKSFFGLMPPTRVCVSLPSDFPLI